MMARWRTQARPEQIAPDGDWNIWVILAGRGWGKTLTGGNWLAESALVQPGTRWAVVAPTSGDAIGVCLDGQSGLLANLPPAAVRSVSRTPGREEVHLANESQINLFSASSPERLRGPQFHGAWCDEVGAWTKPDAWDMLRFGLRLGHHPRTVLTTTPRPTKLMRRILANPSTQITRGSTFDNAANLAPTFLEELRLTYEGTRLGRQELHAEMLDDTVGALWTRTQLDEAYRQDPSATYDRVVVAIDPAVSHGPDSDETGIILAGRVGTGRGAQVEIIADRSGRMTPLEWARAAVALARAHKADCIIAEANNGGALVEANLKSLDHNIPVRLVHASRGKATRAEPVAALYEQGRVTHLPGLAQLEDQMTTWVPGIGNSPDRVDAMVWAVTELVLEGRKPAPLLGPVKGLSRS